MTTNKHLFIQCHDESEVPTEAAMRMVIRRMRWDDIEAIADKIETARSGGKKSGKRVTGLVLIDAMRFNK